jgi:uncharacterized protein (DUF608 family)
MVMPEDKLNRLYAPMGSIGTGCVGIDLRGRLYNDILHPVCTGPLMPDSFAVIRSTFGQGEPYVRALCCGLEGEGEAINAYAPPYLGKEEYKQQLSYPMLSCQLTDSNAPVRAAWTFFSPLALYDHVASVMPGMLLSVRVINPNTRPVLCSFMMCMNNLSTEIDDSGTVKPAPIHFVRVEPTLNDSRSHLGTSLFRGSIADAQPELLKSYVRNALLFGDRRNVSATARPHFCMGAREQLDAVISRGIWDPESTESCEYFWKVFREKGVAAPPRPGTITRAGAMCSAAKIAPGASYRFDFLFTWHVPPALCEERGVANGYMQHFPNAPESIRYGLRHLDYLYKAVSNWQKQLTGSGLPEEFSGALIDSTRAFVTYTRHQQRNGFRLLSQVDSMGENTGSWDFMRAFALLTFAPRFHAAAVTTALTRAEEDSKDLANLKDNVFLRQCAEIILSAYADILYTGNRARFRDWYPRIVSILDAGMHGLLEKLTAAEKDDSIESATILGLWAAAMNAIVLMGQDQNDGPGVQKREPLRHALVAGYDRKLKTVVSQGGRPVATGTPITAALMGACCAELLNLGSIVTAQSIAPLLQKDSWGAVGSAENTSQLQDSRIVTAVAQAFFSKHSLTGEPGRTKTFVTELLTDEVKPASIRAILPNKLGLWTVLQALAGVYYDSLHHSLIVRPSSLSEISTTLPIFTPVSLGKMDIQIEKGQELIVVLRIALETPLTIESIALRLPVTMRAVRASCVQDSETITASQELLPGDGETNLALRFRTPLKLAGMLTLRLRETTPQRM